MTTSWPHWPPPGDPSGGYYARHDWSTEPGIQTKPPEAPKAVRVAYMLEQIAQEFRTLAVNAVHDGKPDVLAATKCTLELDVSWTVEGNADVKFWVLDVGAGGKRETSSKVVVEMSLLSPVPTFAGTHVPGDDAIDWSTEDPAMDRDEVEGVNGGALQLAMMLEKLSDEFRRARAGAAGKAAILRYDKVTLELATATTVDAKLGAKFWVLDLGGGASSDQATTITVEMTPVQIGQLAAGGVTFSARPA